MGTHLKKHIDMTITPGTGRDAPKGARGGKKGKAKGRKKGGGSQDEEGPPPPPPNRDALILKAVHPDRPDYWLFLRAHLMSTLADLDELLREMWATCCPEHASRFIVRGEVFADPGGGDEDDDDDEDYEDDVFEDEDYDDHFDGDDYEDDYLDDPREMLRQLLGMGTEARPLGVPLREIIAHKATFLYVFDDVNEMEIKITAYAAASSAGMDSPIGLLARNEPVVRECSSCHAEDASRVCCQCIEKGVDSVYCVGCAPEHECGDGRLVPLENTPRSGECPLQGLPPEEREERERKALERRFTPFFSLRY